MEPERRWRQIAAGQHQLVTRRQLAAAGMTRSMIRRRVDDGVLAVVHRDVLRLVGVRPTWQQRLMAATLASGPTSVASHRAGALLQGLDGPWQRAEPELTVERPAVGAPDLATIHRTTRLAAVDRSCVDGIPVTSPARTLIDLASVADAPAVEAALDAALRDGVVREAFLRWRLDEIGGRGVSGSGVLQALLGPDRQGRHRLDSWLEARALELFAHHGLPEPSCQRHIRPGSGRLLRLDFAFLDGSVVVEVNGHATHSTRRQRQLDHERANRLTLAGMVVVQFTYEDVTERPEHVVAVVAAALARAMALDPAHGPVTAPHARGMAN